MGLSLKTAREEKIETRGSASRRDAHPFWKRLGSLSSLMPILFFAGAWEIAAAAANHPLYPRFSQVICELYALLFVQDLLWPHLGASLYRVVLGLMAGSAAGFLAGIALGRNPLLEKIFSPLISVLYPIPALGWLPLLMLWIGINEWLPIMIVIICSFFPVMYNTVTGVKSVDPSYVRAARTIGAGEREILWRIILPLAIPNIFTGLRLEAGVAWRVIIAAEMIAIPTGIGVLLIKAESLIRVDLIIVCLLLLSLMCFLFDRTFRIIEEKLTRHWR